MMVLTKEQVAVLKGVTAALFADQRKIPGVITADDLCDSHEELREERDQARRAVCRTLAKHWDEGVVVRWAGHWPRPSGTNDECREVCATFYGSAEAERLFPKKETP